MHSPEIDEETIVPFDYYETLFIGADDGTVSVATMQVDKGWKYGSLTWKAPHTEKNPVTVIKANVHNPHIVLIGYKNRIGAVWNMKVLFLLNN